MGPAAPGVPDVLDRLVKAVSAHDLEAMVSCFAEEYVNETPAHPRRGFRGNAQVRANWSRIFAAVPDVRARVVRLAADGETVWTEWELGGTRSDGMALLMRGVVIFTVVEDTIASARFYLDPVDEASGDVNTHTRRVTGAN